MPLNSEERAAAKQYAVNGADFMLIPYQSLREKIINNHPMTSGINEQLKVFLLEGRAVRIAPEMIIKYCDNTLSRNNTWFLNQGDIKVEPAKVQINKGE